MVTAMQNLCYARCGGCKRRGITGIAILCVLNLTCGQAAHVLLCPWCRWRHTRFTCSAIRMDTVFMNINWKSRLTFKLGTRLWRINTCEKYDIEIMSGLIFVSLILMEGRRYENILFIKDWNTRVTSTFVYTYRRYNTVHTYIHTTYLIHFM